MKNMRIEAQNEKKNWATAIKATDELYLNLAKLEVSSI